MMSCNQIHVPALSEDETHRLVDLLYQLADALLATLPDEHPDPDPDAFYRYCDQLEAEQLNKP